MNRHGPSLLDRTDSRAYLRTALEEGRFALYCQPALGLKEDLIYPLGEVLVRMNEEEQAMLPPGEFLSIMQELGLLPELDRWVVQQVIGRLATGCAVRTLSINLSAETIDDPGFPAFVAREAGLAGLAPASLIFELPFVSAAAAPAQRFAAAIHDNGAGIALEDFPCDSAALDLMRRIRADYIKVDGGLVRKLRGSEEAKRLFRSAVKAASQAQARVVAESVEDLPTLAVAARLGADFAQGFGIYPPKPIGAWLR